MDSDQFRALFNKNRDMPVMLFAGQTLALGLSGENVVLFKPGGHFEMPLSWFEPTSDGGMRQVGEAGNITEEQFRSLGHSIKTR